MSQVWADQIVEDANLTVTMSHLRKALGEKARDHRFIVTIPGRGYRFVGAVRPTETLIVEEHTVSQIVIDELDTNGQSIDAIFETKPYTNLDRYTSRPRDLARTRVWVGLILTAFIASGLAIAAFLKWRTTDSRALPFAGAPIRQLTTKGRVGWIAVSPDAKFYAYSLNEHDFKQSLWLGQIDNAKEIELRPATGVHYRGVQFSPDGKSLYFTVNEADDDASNGFFKISPLGGVIQKLPVEVRDYFTLAPDGNRIAFVRNSKEKSSLIIAGIDGGGERELFARPLETAFFSRLAWSPDSRQIAVVAVSDAVNDSREIFLVQVSDGGIKQLTSSSWLTISNVVWQRDNKGLLVVAASRNEAVRHLWHLDYPTGIAKRISSDTDSYGSALSISGDGNSLLAAQLKRESNVWIASSAKLSQAKQITFSSINGIYGWRGFDWTPDQHIVFTVGIDRTVAIYSMDANGKDLRQITSAGFYDQRPSVTPDGRFIVFQSNRSGAMEIWRVNFDGSDLRQLTTGGRNTQPQATSDGKSVVYISTRNDQETIWRVSIDGGQSLQVSNQACTAVRVSPDGKLIACGYEASNSATRQLAILSSSDGTLIKSFEAPRSSTFNDGVRWMPDGKVICYRDLDNGAWQQSVDGGEPKRLEGLPEEKSYTFGWSRNGKLFAYTRGREIGDAVIIRNSN